MAFRVPFAQFDEGANGRRRRVKDADLVRRDHAPETARIRIGRNALENQLRTAAGQRPIGHIGMTRDPTDIGRTPEHIVRLEIEGPLHGQHGLQQIPRRGVLHALGLAGGTRGVEQKQRVLGLDPFRFTGLRLLRHRLMPPQITPRDHGASPARALINNDACDGFATGHRQGLIHGRFKRNVLAATHLLVGRDDHHRAGIFDAILQ